LNHAEKWGCGQPKTGKNGEFGTYWNLSGSHGDIFGSHRNLPGSHWNLFLGRR